MYKEGKAASTTVIANGSRERIFGKAGLGETPRLDQAKTAKVKVGK